MLIRLWQCTEVAGVLTSLVWYMVGQTAPLYIAEGYD